MCPQFLIPLIGAGMGLVGSLVGPSLAKPPKAQEPAAPADAARTAGATVRVGDGQDDKTTDTGTVGNVTMPETRVFGRPVGGLGKSGLSL